MRANGATPTPNTVVFLPFDLGDSIGLEAVDGRICPFDPQSMRYQLCGYFSSLAVVRHLYGALVVDYLIAVEL